MTDWNTEKCGFAGHFPGNEAVFREIPLDFLARSLSATDFIYQPPVLVQVCLSVPFQGELRTMAKAAPAKKPLTKSQLVANIAEETEVPKKQVAAVLESLANQIKTSLGNKGPGAIAIAGLVKIEKKRVPARKAQKGVPNPFKPGELMDRPAKPAYNKVKVRALKLLKEMAK